MILAFAASVIPIPLPQVMDYQISCTVLTRGHVKQHVQGKIVWVKRGREIELTSDTSEFPVSGGMATATGPHEASYIVTNEAESYIYQFKLPSRDSSVNGLLTITKHQGDLGIATYLAAGTCDAVATEVSPNE